MIENFNSHPVRLCSTRLDNFSNRGGNSYFFFFSFFVQFCFSCWFHSSKLDDAGKVIEQTERRIDERRNAIAPHVALHRGQFAQHLQSVRSSFVQYVSKLIRVCANKQTKPLLVGRDCFRPNPCREPVLIRIASHSPERHKHKNVQEAVTRRKTSNQA